MATGSISRVRVIMAAGAGNCVVSAFPLPGHLVARDVDPLEDIDRLAQLEVGRFTALGAVRGLIELIDLRQPLVDASLLQAGRNVRLSLAIPGTRMVQQTVLLLVLGRLRGVPPAVGQGKLIVGLRGSGQFLLGPDSSRQRRFPWPTSAAPFFQSPFTAARYRPTR